MIGNADHVADIHAASIVWIAEQRGLPKFEGEFSVFPNVHHDDQIDSVSQA